MGRFLLVVLLALADPQTRVTPVPAGPRGPVGLSPVVGTPGPTTTIRIDPPTSVTVTTSDVERRVDDPINAASGGSAPPAQERPEEGELEEVDQREEAAQKIVLVVYPPQMTIGIASAVTAWICTPEQVELIAGGLAPNVTSTRFDAPESADVLTALIADGFFVVGTREEPTWPAIPRWSWQVVPQNPGRFTLYLAIGEQRYPFDVDVIAPAAEPRTPGPAPITTPGAAIGLLVLGAVIGSMAHALAARRGRS